MIFADVRKLLPQIPSDVTFVVQTAAYECIPETGDGGYTKNSRLIILSLDPGLPYGEEKVLASTRCTLFHELHHAARFEAGIFHPTFLDSCIMEGLATVFERDRAECQPLWGLYKPEEAEVWLQEIIAQGDNVPHYPYMYRHNDGRRWIGYKVGTYLIDKVLKASGKSIEELTILECGEIKRLAGVA